MKAWFRAVIGCLAISAALGNLSARAVSADALRAQSADSSAVTAGLEEQFGGEGIGFFQRLADPVARALRKFPGVEQQPTLEAINAFRQAVHRNAPHNLGYHYFQQSLRRGLNNALVRRVNETSTAIDVQKWAEAAANLAERFITLRKRGGKVPELYRERDFETLVDRAVRFRQNGIAYELIQTSGWGPRHGLRIIPSDPSRLVETLPDEVAEALGKFPPQDQLVLARQLEALRQQVDTWPASLSYPRLLLLQSNPNLSQMATSVLASSATATEAQARVAALGELFRQIKAAAEQVKGLTWAQVPVTDLTRRIAHLTVAGVHFELAIVPEWGSEMTLQVVPHDPAYVAETVPHDIVQAIGKFPLSEQHAVLQAVLDLQRQAHPAYIPQPVPQGHYGTPRRIQIPSLVTLLAPKLQASANAQDATAWIGVLSEFYRTVGQPRVTVKWEKPCAACVTESATLEQARARLAVLAGFLERIPAELVVPAAQRRITVGDAARTLQVYEAVANPGSVTGMGAARQALERIEIARTLAQRMEEDPTLEWAKVSSQQFAGLAQAATQFHRQGFDYTVQVAPEKGHTTQVVRTGYSETDFYGGGESYTYYENVYVMDSSQTVQLIPQGAALPIMVRSLALDEAFLRTSGLLDVVAQAYRQEREHPRDAEVLRQWLAAQPVGEGVMFNLPQVGVLPRYYPMDALGQSVVIRVYEVGQEWTLAPVTTVLVQGAIDERLRYQVLPREEFEQILAPDGMIPWTVTTPAVMPPLQMSQGVPAVLDMVPDDILRQLSAEFALDRLSEAATMHSPQVQAALAADAERQTQMDDLRRRADAAGIAVTPELLRQAAAGLRDQPALLYGIGEEAQVLRTLNRLVGETLGNHTPEVKAAFFEVAARAADPAEHHVVTEQGQQLQRAREVGARAIALGVPAEQLFPALQRAVWLAQVPTDETTRAQLEARNWVWRSLAGGLEELTQAEAWERIRTLKEQVPALLGALQQVQIERPVSVYALGSYVWGQEPNDVDLIVVTEGHQLFEPLEPRLVEGVDLPLHMRVVGLDTLSRAVAGETVENFQRIRLEAMVLYGSAVLIAGHDLFADSQLPTENLAGLVEHFQATAQHLEGAKTLTEAQRRAKATRWLREVAAMEQVIAERRAALVAEALEHRMAVLTEASSRLDHALQPSAAPLAPWPDVQRATILLPKEALIDGAALVAVRRIQQQHPGMTLVVAGAVTPEERTVLGRLAPHLEILETPPIVDRDSATQALELAKAAPWWQTDIPVRLLVPTLSPDDRPETVAGARLLYYLVPMADELLVLDTLLQAASQDLFVPTFPVVQVILARVPVSEHLGSLVVDFQQSWDLSIGA